MTHIALAALALFVFSIPSENGVTIPGLGSLSRLIGFGAVSLAVISLYDRGRLRFRSPSLFLVMAAVFVTWAAMTYFWSVEPSASISRTLQFVQLLVFAWMVHQVARSDGDRDVLMQAFVLGCYLMIAVAVATALGSSRAGYRDVAFPANSFAIVAALAIPMAWGLMLRRSFPLLQILNIAYPVLALVAVVLAASRGGLLTAVTALAIIPISMPRLSHLRRLVLMGVVAAVALSAYTWLPQAIPDLERNLERLGRVEEDLIDGTMTGRTDIWAAGAQVFATSPMLGAGIGTYRIAVEPLLGRSVGAHNAFLSIAVTSGLIGVLLFTAMFVIVLVGIIAYPQRRAEYIVLFAALIVGTMPSNAENDKFLWYVLAALASARPVIIRVGATVRRHRQPAAPREPSTAGARPGEN